MKNWLMNNVHWGSRINFAPPGEGGGGGGGEGAEDGGDEENSELLEGDDTQSGGDSGADDIINLDGPALLTKMFGDGDEDQPLDIESKLEVKDAAALVADMNGYINEKVIVPEKMLTELIPDDFNPSDRNQMGKLLTSVMQLGVRHALQASFMPTKNALASQQNTITKTVSEALSRVRGGDKTRQSLEAEIPAATHPAHGGLVRQIHANSLRLAKNDPAKAYTLTRKALQGMQIDPNKGGKDAARTTGPGSSGVKTGAAALDLFVPMPKPTGPAKTQNAMRRQ